MGDQGSKRLLFYRTREQVEEYRRLPAADKLARLQAQMEFFHKTMPEKARRIRDRIKEDKG